MAVGVCTDVGHERTRDAGCQSRAMGHILRTRFLLLLSSARFLDISSTAKQHVPAPPPVQRPRSSSSLFKEKFARRFLRRNGAGAGRGPTSAQIRGGDDGNGGNGNEGVGGGQGRRRGGAGHGGSGRRDEPSMSSDSHCRSHITSVALSHMYQVGAGLRGGRGLC